MANTESMKLNLKILKQLFPKDHERFRFLPAATDQFTCRFIDENCKKTDIHATIPDFYPSDPIIWYTDSEETNVIEMVEKLSDTNRNEIGFLNQIDTLLRELCHLHNIQIPKEATALLNGESSNVKVIEDSSAKQMPEQKEADETSDMDADADSDPEQEGSVELDDSVFTTDKTDDEPKVKETHLKLFKGFKQNPSSQVTTNRLMKEIREIYRSDSYKNGDYTVEMVGDSIYNWNVELRAIDEDSKLYEDLMKLKKIEGKDSIVLNMTFNDKYPLEPPFVRIVHPVLMCKHVVGGGAICTELLLKQCWSPGYTIESVIIQMAALLVKGNARIDFTSKSTQYSLAAAKSGFTEVTSAKSSGWFDSFKESS